MTAITIDEHQELQDNFETMALLDVVDEFNTAQAALAKTTTHDLMVLHELAMNVINHQSLEQAEAMFDKAFELEEQIGDAAEALAKARDTLEKLTTLFPESLLSG